MENKVQITANSMNSLSSGDVLYEKGDAVDSIALLVKGRRSEERRVGKEC